MYFLGINIFPYTVLNGKLQSMFGIKTISSVFSIQSCFQLCVRIHRSGYMTFSNFCVTVDMTTAGFYFRCVKCVKPNLYFGVVASCNIIDMFRCTPSLVSG